MTKSKKNNLPTIDTLEARTMMAAHGLKAEAPVALDITTAAYNEGTQLVINGSAKNDNINVTRTDAGLLITNTGGWNTLITGDYKSIRVNGNAGNDTITIDASVNTNTVLHGNAGNDSLTGGNGNDQLFGEAGNDTLNGRGGNDTFVTLGGGKDIVNGNDGYDSFWIDSKNDTVTATNDEVASGAVHKVAGFESIKTTTTTGKKTKVTTTAISIELNGQNLIDPKAEGTVYQNFAGHQLFSDAGPIANDIEQGYLGDCYFLATLSSVAKTDANLIKQSVVDLGDGTFAVKFMKGNKEMYFRVDADLPTWGNGSLAYANTGSQGSLWVAVMEKAFAAFRTGANSYASIEAGWMSEVYAALGKTSTNYFSAGTAASLINTIKIALEQGKSVTYGANTPTDGAPLIGCHAYSVDRVNLDTNGNAVSVTLRNHWAIDGVGNDGQNDGYVTVTAAQLQHNFLGLMIAAV